jgi:PAS domain S-box-containing protein
MNKIFVRNFRIKLASFLILATLIPIVALEVISVYDGLRYERHVIEKIENDDLESQIKIFDYWLDGNKEEMNVMTRIFEDAYAIDSSKLNLSYVLNEFETQNEDILNTYFTSEAGMNVVSGFQEGVVDGRNRKWYKNALIEGLSVSSPYVDALTENHVITLSSVVKFKDTVIGVIGVDYLFDQVMEDFFQPFNEETTKIVVFDNQLNTIYKTSNSSDEALKRFVASGEKNEGIFSKTSVIEKKVESLKIEVYVIFERLSILPITPKNQHFGIEGVFVTIILVVLLSLVVSKFLSKPMSQLEEKAKSIVENRHIEVNETGYKDLDEIIDLFINFQKTINKNTRSIGKMRMELDDRNQTLLSLNMEYEKAYEELERFSKALSEKESEYENLVSNIVDMIWTIDYKGQLTYANDKMLEILGYDESELIGLQLSELVPALKMYYGNHSPYDLLHTRDYEAIDMTFVDKNNDKSVITSTSTTRIFQNKQELSIQGVSRDITLEKKMYNELNVRNRDLMLINKISKEMTMTDDMQSVLDLILDNVDTIFEIKIASIRFLDKDGQLKGRAYKGESGELLWSMASAEALSSHIGYAIEKRQAVVLNTLDDILVEEDKAMIETVEKGYKIAILPLNNSERTFGALSIISIDRVDDRIMEVLSAFANSTSVALERAILFETLENHYLKTIETLVTAMEAKNHLMQGHSNRVSLLSEYIGEKLYLSKEEVKDLYVAALLHDVGKIGLRDAVLRKDFSKGAESVKTEITEKHIEIGKKILLPIGLKNRILEGVYYHHKHFDQSGYPPEALSEVPLFALIIGVADDIDIMMKRNKDKLLTITETKAALIKKSGSKYSPEIVNLVVDLIDSEDKRLLKILDIGV